MTRIVVTGCRGQVGWELMRTLQPLGQVIGLDRASLDISDHISVRSLFERQRPDVIVNCAAYTAVDRAEASERAAHAVNAEAVAQIASCARSHGSLLVHFSTDYVFSGDKASPYTEEDEPAPLNVYGRTKLLGERALAASGADWLCLRTSWVYAPRGRNFFRTILRLGMERDHLQVVSDQHGAPTSARLVAEATSHVIGAALKERLDGRFISGVLHLTATGSTTWHGFAEAILLRAKQSPLADRITVSRFNPIASADYPVAARRPSNSQLSCQAIGRRFGVCLTSWEEALDMSMNEFLDAAPPL